MYHLASEEIPERLYSPAWRRLKELASPAYLRNPTDGHIGNVTAADVRLGLQWSAWACRKFDEEAVDESAIQELLIRLKEADDALDDPSLPATLRSFGKRQIETIRAALRVAGLRGSREVRQAVEVVAGAFATNAAVRTAFEQSSPQARTAFSKVGEAVVTAAKYCDAFSKMKKGAEDLGEATALVVTHLGPYVPAILTYAQTVLRLPGAS